MVKISVIVPVYQVERYLERCLNSIMSQQFDDFEVICINDGSRDGSVDILNTFAHYDNLRIIHQENAGLSSARNAGIAVAQGEYLTFVDSDDWLAPNFLEQLYETAINTQYKIIKCNIKAIYPHHETDFYHLSTGWYDLDRVLAFQPSAWSALYHRSIWQHFKYPEGLLFEDLATWPYLLQQAGGVYYIDQVLYYYNCTNDSSIMNNPNQRHLVMDQVFDYILKHVDRSQPKMNRLVTFLYLRHVLIYHLAIVKYFLPPVRQAYLHHIYQYTARHFKEYPQYLASFHHDLDLHRKKDWLALKYFLNTKGYSYRLKWLYEDKVGR